jgi:hypothetical protein
MRYTLSLTSNNITFKEGDSILISFSNPFLYIQSIDDIQFDLIPLDTLENGHDIQIRWSYDVAQLDRATGKPHVVWSSWIDFKRDSILNPNLQQLYTEILQKSDSIDLEFRFVRKGPEVGARRIETVQLEITHKNPPEKTLRAKDLFPTSSDCKASSCITPNFNSGVSLNCNKDTLFRPYDVMGPGIQLWKDLSCAVSEMFGHCVRYFKTQAKLESADTILKEYSLYEVTDVKDIKILVPDNALPDNAIKFMPYDMDFGDGLEVHIVKEHFERAFGFDDLPEQKDYLYFPLIDRVFEVHSAYLFRDFMAAEAYYKVMLFKWQDKANVMRENPEIAQYIDDLTENFDEILQPEIDKEYIDVTKPQQYSTVAVGGFDKVRSSINQNLKIEVSDLTNYFTVVGKYFYNLSNNMNWGDLAVKYKLDVNRKITDNTAFTMWFKTTKTTFKNSPNTFDVLLEGYNDQLNKGFRFTLDYSAGATVDSAVVKSITAKVNEETITFDIPELTPEKWYGIVINHSNEFSQLSVFVWEMKYNQNQPTQNKTTDLKLIYSKVNSITPADVISGGTFEMRAGTLGVTNVRVMSETIEEEKQPLFLNQYIVREARYGLCIDNVIPPLRMIKEYIR